MHKIPFLTIPCLLLFMLITSGCSNIPGIYQIDIRQGNYLDQALVNQLRPGMSKRQVEALLGTPLISDPFHQNRWDYVYSFRTDSELVEKRQVSLFFQGELLSRIEPGPNLR